MDLSHFLHFDWETVPFRLIAFVIAFSLHEWAHAYTAWRLGDSTAKDEGRLTLNPIPHIDPFGMILILFGPFGWAKPVPVNPFRFRGNRRLGMVAVAAAGPLVNLVLAVLFYMLWLYVEAERWLDALPPMAAQAIEYTLSFSVLINCGLFVFNLLPVPPLDGSNIVRYLAPRRFDPFFHRWNVYGPWVLLLLIFIPALNRFILGIPLAVLLSGVRDIAGLLMKPIL